MKKRICIYLLGTLLLMAAVSCSSTKKMKKDTSIGSLSQTEYMEEVISRVPTWRNLIAKVALTVDLNGKGGTRVNGTLRMKRDEVIQLSIAPVLGIEVARAEISPAGVLVVDRMNKRYVRASFAEVEALAKAELDFHAIQALFLNEIFLPGKKTLAVRDVSDFVVRPEDEVAVWEAKNGKRFAYRFRTTVREGLLKETRIGLAGTPYGLRWRYDSFRPLEQKQFPGYMLVSFEGGSRPVTATLDLSRLSTEDDWEAHTQLPRKYEKVELQDLLRQLVK